MKENRYRRIWVVVFVLAVGLRLGLALVNNGSANDDHLEVSRIILTTGSIPEPEDCWQCYHPKLFHYSMATLWKVLNINPWSWQHKLAQLINCAAGIITLLLLRRFMRNLPFPDPVKLIVFALIALNPSLVAISIQPSNDAFIILFGTVMIYCIYRLLEQFRIKYLLLLVLFTALAGATKASALVLITGVIVVWSIKLVLDRSYQRPFSRWHIPALLIYVVISLTSTLFLGEYYINYKKYDKPVVYNTPTGDVPHWYVKSDFRRPGVQSILEGYFTFRLIDMLKTPVVSNEDHVYPKHRTSVWSQLYGRSHFIYFENWPPGPWQTNNPAMWWTGRVALVLALLPLGLLLIGFWKTFRVWPQWVFMRRDDFIKNGHEWILHAFMVGFILFIILFTLYGRDYSFMKVIYLFPGLLAFSIPLLKGVAFAYQYFEGKQTLIKIFYTVFIMLFICYIIPLTDLMAKFV
jgi:hypothetical protein